MLYPADGIGLIPAFKTLYLTFTQLQQAGGFAYGKIGAVSAELCEQLKRNTKDQLSCTIAPGSTMGLDSSAPTVSGGWLWQMRSVSAVRSA